MFCRGRRAAQIVAPLALLSSAAFAGHPMLSEDTGTQGRGNLELEFGNAWAHERGDNSFVFQPQLSLGASPTFDLILQPSWLKDGSQGFGDTNFDAKWRFYGAAPWSLGLRAGVEWPTAEHHMGLPPGQVSPHALLVATMDSAPFTLDANLGYAHVPGDSGARSDLYHFSIAGMLSSSERLFFVLDAAVDSNPDASRASLPAVALFGVIYTARAGLDLDVGYRAGLDAAAPARQWLLGITYRGAP